MGRRNLLGRALGLGFCIALGVGQATQAQTAQVAKDLGRVVIPMDHKSGFLQLQVMVNGEGPFLFQLDTYASIDACVDDDFAKAMGFEKTGTTMNSDGETVREKDLVRIDELRLGAARFTNANALVDDYDWVDKQGRRVHGLLGFRLFRELLLTIDYPGSQIILERGELAADEPHCLPFQVTSGSPDIILNLGGEPTLFGIDTGMRSGFMLMVDDAKRLGLADDLKPAGTARTAYSSYSLFQANMLEDVDLAGHRIEEPSALFRTGDVRRLVGKGLLSPFALTFDQKHRRLRIVVPKSKTPGSSKR